MFGQNSARKTTHISGGEGKKKENNLPLWLSVFWLNYCEEYLHRRNIFG